MGIGTRSYAYGGKGPREARGGKDVPGAGQSGLRNRDQRRPAKQFIEWVTGKLSRREREQLHREITKKNYGEDEILEIVEELFGRDKRPDVRWVGRDAKSIDHDRCSCSRTGSCGSWGVRMDVEIQRALGELIGLPWWTAGRAADVHWFHFGGQRRIGSRLGGPKTVGDYALHLQCAWRLVNGRQIVVGSADAWQDVEQNDLVPLDSDGRPPRKRLDALWASFFRGGSGNAPRVVNVRVDLYGGFEVFFDGGLTLEAFPDGTAGEWWRLFRPTSDAPHFVVGADGIETDAELE